MKIVTRDDRRIIIKGLEERLVKKWKAEKPDEPLPAKPRKPNSIPKVKKNTTPEK